MILKSNDDIMSKIQLGIDLYSYQNRITMNFTHKRNEIFQIDTHRLSLYLIAVQQSKRIIKRKAL